jgi:hypothetical protein
MATLQLNLPEGVKQTAEARAIEGGYDSVDGYITSLIEADEVAPISSETEAELLKGLNSGPSVEITPRFLADLRERAKRKNSG